MRAVIVTTGNEAYIKDLQEPVLDALQKEVKGFIEIVRPAGLDPEHAMVVNDTGLILGLPVNRFASAVYGNQIVGNVAIVKEGLTPDGYDFIDFEDAELNYLFQQISSVPYITIRRS